MAITQLPSVRYAQARSMPEAGRNARAEPGVMRSALTAPSTSAMLTGVMACCPTAAMYVAWYCAAWPRHDAVVTTTCTRADLACRSPSWGAAHTARGPQSCITTATRKPWCERPLRSGAGPPRVFGPGVVHTTACSPFWTPWSAGGRQGAPPDRRRCDRQQLL